MKVYMRINIMRIKSRVYSRYDNIYSRKKSESVN